MTAEALKSWFVANAPAFGGQLAFEEPLAKHTYYRIGGPALLLATPKGEGDLALLAEAARAHALPLFVLGLGSNVLVSDGGYRGIVVKATRIDLGLEPTVGTQSDEFRVRAGASVAVSTLLRRAAAEGWGGLEFLTGVPGSVGGAVRMNAGTHLGESESRLASVRAFLGFCVPDATSVRSYDRVEMSFAYRKNLFLPERALVLSAEWRVNRETSEIVKARIDELLARRKATQPVDLPSCGSVFKNPRESGYSAWQVLDKVGLRGHRIGGAQISEKHSNFIVNNGGATAADVRGLIELAKRRAAAELGVLLQEEVIYVDTAMTTGGSG